ncbi:hypothetical protein [Bradyrhizobium iriomotense]|uniref:Uncharacterized protein n=1 Tax=Bradyrhizobium iriomotense TaxID=441950 RepID=A0ABQ6BBP8_9BRAD|nr:hypothetical protein [Bradyrhizobium iriomotense]GLR91859.1 hypothetical protein GCM10007857_85770 [Bradyrhizobium iriomotense]
MVSKMKIDAFTVDRRQLACIESAHRGFLYTKIISIQWPARFRQPGQRVTHIVVEKDVELTLPEKRIYGSRREQRA